MARLARLALSGQLHLLMQRGHGDHVVFQGDEDFRLYLQSLRRVAAQHHVAIHAYALLDDRVLLLATPSGEAQSLGRMLQSLGRLFGAEINRRRGRRGSVWDGRFRSAVVDAAAHLIDAIRYVEDAPWAAGLAADPMDYPWSSAAHHGGRRTDPVVTEHPLYWRMGNTPFEREARHRELLGQPLAPALKRQMDDALCRGWPVGDAAFTGAIADETNRPLGPRPRGRPRKISGSG